MTKYDVIRELYDLRRYDLYPSMYTVVYGAAMVLRGIKEQCNDIDVTASMDVLNMLQDRGLEIKPYNGDPNNPHVHIGSIDVFGKFTPYTSLRSAWYQDFQIQTVRSLLDEKNKRGREKDLKDVQLIWDWILKSKKTK